MRVVVGDEARLDHHGHGGERVEAASHPGVGPAVARQVQQQPQPAALHEHGGQFAVRQERVHLVTCGPNGTTASVAGGAVGMPVAALPDGGLADSERGWR